jgi:carbon storage regulator CsrA
MVRRSLARDRRRPDFWRPPVLVLQRREGQSVVIPGCRVEVVVKEVAAGTVKLGFLAPDHVDIYRDEIWRAMCFADWNKDNRSNHDGNED